jgi:hypothetical protein
MSLLCTLDFFLAILQIFIPLSRSNCPLWPSVLFQFIRLCHVYLISLCVPFSFGSLSENRKEVLGRTNSLLSLDTVEYIENNASNVFLQERLY